MIQILGWSPILRFSNHFSLSRKKMAGGNTPSNSSLVVFYKIRLESHGDYHLTSHIRSFRHETSSVSLKKEAWVELRVTASQGTKQKNKLVSGSCLGQKSQSHTMTVWNKCSQLWINPRGCLDFLSKMFETRSCQVLNSTLFTVGPSECSLTRNHSSLNEEKGGLFPLDKKDSYTL